MPDRETPYPGLLVDFGGVLTGNVFEVFAGFCEREGLETDHVARAFREDPVTRELLFGLELGELTEDDFSGRFAASIGLGPERVEGLIGRLWQDLAPDEEMIEAVAGFHAAGVKTGLISNSWGTALEYDEKTMARLFDGLVISHLEGMRKPDPKIYALGAARIGLSPADCVFVDDLRGNLKPARALGMMTVHHTTAAETIPQLEELLGVTLPA